MTAIAFDLEQQITLLGPRFQLRFLHALEALTAILAKYGLDRVIAWANADGGDEARFVAALFKDTAVAVKVLTEYVDAMRAGNVKKIAKVRKRLDKLIGPRLGH